MHHEERSTTREPQTEAREQDPLLPLLQSLLDISIRFFLEGLRVASPEDLKALEDVAFGLRELPADRLQYQIPRLIEALRRFQKGRSPEELGHLCDILIDVFYSCRAMKTYLSGRFKDVDALEGLMGKDRIGREVDVRRNMTLLEVGFTIHRPTQDSRVESSLLVSLSEGEFFVEQLVTTGRASTQRPSKHSYAGRLEVRSAGISPGFAPRVVTLFDMVEKDLLQDDLEALVALGRQDLKGLSSDYRSHRSNLFAPEEYPIILVPKAFHGEKDLVSAVDRTGHLLRLAPSARSSYLPDSLVRRLATASIKAVVGKVFPAEGQLHLVPLSLVSKGASGFKLEKLHWPEGVVTRG